MSEADEPRVDWRDLATAVPGAASVQTGEAFAHVSEDFAATVGVDADVLVGEDWRTAFPADEADRLEAAVETARAEGQWEGTARIDGDGGPVDLTLSTTDGGAVLWIVREREVATAEGDLSERQRRLFARPEFVRTVLDAIDDVLYVIDEDGGMYLCNETLVETTGYSHEEIEEMHPMNLVAEYDHEYVPGLMEAIGAIEDRRVDVDISTKDGAAITHEFKGTTFEDPETGEQFRCGLARDVSEQRRREADLQRQLDELATLERITEILRGMVGQIVETPTRAAVERRVCEGLAAADLYRFAWLGERTLDAEGVVEQASAGAVPDDPVTVGRDGDGTTLADRAISTADVQVATADAGGEAWDRTDLTGVAAVPLYHEESVNGVLVVGTGRETAFSDRERTGLDVLGRTVGVVVDAARRRELLFADSVVELEFQVHEGDGVVLETAAALECRLGLEGYVASGDDWILYLSVEGASDDAVVDALSGDDRVARARSLAEGRVELVTGSPLLDAVAAAGGVVATATADRERGRLLVEAPLSTDVRSLVEGLQRRVPSAELVARRDRDRGVTTSDRPGDPLDDLTDRQRESLEAAYRAGYFDWPRESTAEQVADALSVSSPTLHGHLRKAESAVLSRLFDTGSRSEPTAAGERASGSPTAEPSSGETDE